MNDQEIIKTLAEFLGWEECTLENCSCGSYYNRDFPASARPLASFRFLASRDALAPVLEKITTEMQDLLLSKVLHRYMDTRTVVQIWWIILTLPPRDLARLLAETIKETTK